MNFSLKSDASSIKNSSKYGTKLFHIRNFHCGELFCSSNQLVKNSSKHGTKLYNLRNFYYLELFCFTGGTEIKVEPGWSEHSSKYVTIFFYLWNFHDETIVFACVARNHFSSNQNAKTLFSLINMHI